MTLQTFEEREGSEQPVAARIVTQSCERRPVIRRQRYSPPQHTPPLVACYERRVMIQHQLIVFILYKIFIINYVYVECASDTTILMGYLTGSHRRHGDSVYSRPGQTISGAISYAVEAINRNHSLVQNMSLAFIVAETFGDESESIKQTAQLWSSGNVSVYIGPQETCVHEARMAASFNLPMISYFCTHAETSDKNIFPTFARTRPPDTSISKSVVSLLVRFAWRKVALIYSKHQTATRDYEAIARTIRLTFDANDISVQFQDKWTTAYYHGYTDNPFNDIVERSHTQARIYVIVGDCFEHLGLLLSLSRKNLLATGNYFVVGVDVEHYDPQQAHKYFYGILKSGNDEMTRNREQSEVKQAFQSYLGIFSSPPSGFEKFALQVNKYMREKPFQLVNPIQSDFDALRRIPPEAAYLYDAVYLYARAVNECLINDEDYRDGQIIFSHIRSRPYFSAMGFMVWMDEKGDAEGNYTLVARKKRESDGLYPIGTFLLPANSSQVPMLNIADEIEWPSSQPPADEPLCGFHQEKCKAAPVKWIVSLVTLVTLVLLIIAAALYKVWRYEQELASLLWKIDLKDICITDTGPTNKAKSRHSSSISLNSTCDLMEFRYCNVYTDIALYKGQLVAMKKLYKKNIEITRKMKKELNLMKDLRHDNLNCFFGVAIEAPLICIITEYCSRGSLQVVLQNENFNLDNIFAASMIGDIIRGMIYLHDSPVVSHGNLKSSNCLVDCRWTIKLSDFGLCELKSGTSDACEGSPNNKKNIDTHCEKLLWKSPEILRDQTGTLSRGTQKGDVYSFGLILYELLGRSGPWGKTSFSSSEIIRRVITRTFGIEPFRPSLDLLLAKKDICDLTDYVYDCIVQTMVTCWTENSEERPDFKNLRARLRGIRKGMKNNIMDNMLELMERYSTNLEAIVDERTDLLVQEKKRTEALLYEMLPRTVADQLRKGNKIEAESFDCVTVFFSDIVGFTRMSAMSTPLQTCDLLNDLYTLFDSIIDSYDVYKVETIGDSYMVASGLPIRNGQKHASEIASMALHLQDAMKRFTIRHAPNEQLLVRIGIHSGPVCAGVVGVKMPRYCLFGDTVNTASRMESTSLPLKIHCSEGFKSVLDKIGGYELADRGKVTIKGKGEMQTYWLVGEIDSKRALKNVSPTRLKTKKFTDLFPPGDMRVKGEFRPRTAATIGEEYLLTRKSTFCAIRRNIARNKDLNKSASTSYSDGKSCFTGGNEFSLSHHLELINLSKSKSIHTATIETTDNDARVTLQQIVLESTKCIPKSKIVDNPVTRCESQPFLSEEKVDIEST